MRQTSTQVGKRIRAAREQAGLSQSDLADALGKTQTAISQWESGKRAPAVDDLIAVARIVGQPIAALLPDDHDARPPMRKVLLRAVLDTFDSKELEAGLRDFLDQAERLEPLEPRITVAADRPLRAAQELLSRAARVEPVATGVPVDVTKLAELCGVHVIFTAFDELEDDELSGLTVSLETGPVIGVNKRQYELRQRFTIAHELGHLLLRHHDRFHIDFGRPAESGDSPFYDWRLEREANDFAANLLMPADYVRDRWQNRSTVRRLANDFGVSPVAMSYRLINLGLQDHGQ